jgi:hypothetical protein
LIKTPESASEAMKLKGENAREKREEEGRARAVTVCEHGVRLAEVAVDHGTKSHLPVRLVRNVGGGTAARQL